MKLRTVLLCALAALPAFAAAQQARAITFVNLRAGPDRDYPLVASFGAGTPLAVQGCTDGYGWCDVIAPNGIRGWVYAGNIGYPYQSAEVPVITYGPQIGIPIIAFALGTYWGSYYSNRPWYRDRDRWDRYRPPPRPEYRPPVRPLPGPRPPPIAYPGGRPPHDGRPPDDNRPPRGDRPLPPQGKVIRENGKPVMIVTPPPKGNVPAPERGPN